MQPHRMMDLLSHIAETSSETMTRSIMTLSAAQARSRPGCKELQGVLRAPVDDEMLSCPVKRAALAVLRASYNVRESGLFFFSPLPLLLASGTMGIEMAIAPLWVKGIWD